MKVSFQQVFGLKEDQETNEKIRQRIENGADVTGTNMYILIFAILIASIGLNMDSTAVVIGAMLISPLMGVIISIAYGIAGNDPAWVKKGLYRFAFQIVVSLITSTVYFSLSPMRNFSSELLARTQPTLWDVLIALFGGFAAIIAGTRKSIISNVIPGAAIATALMPPICTAGYCLSTGRWVAALGAGYLFLINAVFICLASVVGLLFMHVTSMKEGVYTKKKRFFIGCVILLLVLPSGFVAWNSVKGATIQEQFKSFVETEFRFDHTQVVKSGINRDKKTMEIILVGDVVDQARIEDVRSRLGNYNLEEYSLDVIQTPTEFGVTEDEIQAILDRDSKNDTSTEMEIELSSLKDLLRIKTEEKELQMEALAEIKLLYPKIQEAGFSNMYHRDGEFEYSLVIVTDEEFSKEEEESIKIWLEQKSGKEIGLIQVTRFEEE